MWSIIAVLKSELDSSVYVESVPPAPLSNNPIWHKSILSLDGYNLGTNTLTLEFVLSSTLGRILVTSSSIPVGRLNYICENMDQSPSSTRTFESPPVTNILKVDQTLEISYVAYKYREIVDGCPLMLGQIHISVISLKYDVLSIFKRPGHKITCLVNETYLGRPQECMTRGTLRSYYWKNASDTPRSDVRMKGTLTPRGSYVAPTLSPRLAGDFDLLVEYNSDLSLIRMATPSGMKRHATVTNYVPDNDAYNNPNSVLPIYFSDSDKPLTVKLFNFGFMPPKCVEVTIKWKDIVATRPIQPPAIVEKKTILRRKVPLLHIDQRMYVFSREMTSGFKLLMHYYMMDPSRIRVVVLYVHIENFEETLKMDQPQERTTV